MADDTTPLLNPQALKAAQTMLGAKFPRVFGYYVEDTENYLKAIEAGYAVRDIMAIIPAAHTIKSSSFQLGIAALSQMAAALETAGREIAAGSNQFENIEKLVIEIGPLYRASKKEVDLLIDTVP